MGPLAHPNLVRMYGAVWNEGPDKLYLVLEYVQNGSLLDVLDPADFPCTCCPTADGLRLPTLLAALEEELSGDFKDGVLALVKGQARVDAEAHEAKEGVLNATRLPRRAVRLFAALDLPLSVLEAVHIDAQVLLEPSDGESEDEEAEADAGVQQQRKRAKA